MDWKWWLRNIIHIESLFVICTIVIVIYLIWFQKKKNSANFIKDIADETGIAFENGKFIIPEIMIRRPPKKERKVNKHEERCREIFQNIYGVKFKSVRPDWLKNPVTNQNLELDGFNPDIATKIGKGLAFEYDGEQHSKYNRHFHRGGPAEFIYQTKKDSWKDLKCKEMGVTLIRIPYFVTFSDLERYIRQALKKEGI